MDSTSNCAIVWANATNVGCVDAASNTLTLSNKTFVAPALGTPISGVATNLTGLPLTTGVTGILPSANGGTGVNNTASLTLGTSNQNWATLGTGIVKNTTTTGALSDAASADVYGLFTSCTGSSGLFLKDGGTCASPGGGVSSVNTLTGAVVIEAATAGQMAVSGGNAAALTGAADMTYSTHTFATTANGIFDWSAATGANSFKLPAVIGGTVLGGISTANLSAPIVITNTNSTNNNTSITMGITAPGTSTGQTVLNVNGAPTGGDLADFGIGGSWASGVLSGQTIEVAITPAGYIKTGTAPVITTPGTGFPIFGTEGTEPSSIASGTSGFVMDSTLHCPVAWFNATNEGCVAALSAANAFTGATTLKTIGTATNCSSAASPAVCSSAASGSVALPTGTNPTLVVNTTAVTANSQILLTVDESLGTKLSVTCNTTLSTLLNPVVTARTAATSFTFTIGAVIAANPACVSYTIIN
jgi:hypothetical protein